MKPKIYIQTKKDKETAEIMDKIMESQMTTKPTTSDYREVKEHCSFGCTACEAQERGIKTKHTTSDYQEVDRRLTTLIKDNLWGLVCDKCTGGGWDYDEKEKCKQCGGCGIYDWRVEPLLKLFHSELDRVREETIKACIEALPKKIGESRSDRLFDTPMGVVDMDDEEVEAFNEAIDQAQTALTQLAKDNK